MGRSPRFGSILRNSTPNSDSLSLRLRLVGLTLLRRITRRLIKQKAHDQALPLRAIALSLLVGVRFQVLFHSPHRGSFHLSLAVLVRYRSSGSIEPWKVVLPDSHWVSRAPWYSGPSPSEPGSFRLRGCHPLRPAFPDRSAKILVCDSPTAPYRYPAKAFDPPHTTHTDLAYVGFRLFPFRSPLLGESRLLSFPAGTEMFHFPAWASLSLCIQKRIGGIHRLGFPIRASSDHGLLAAPRGLSQLATPFIAS